MPVRTPRLPDSKQRYLRDMGRVMMTVELGKNPQIDRMGGRAGFSLGGAPLTDRLVDIAEWAICDAAIQAGGPDWKDAKWETEFTRIDQTSGTIRFEIRKHG
jgi:hypothetical protein